MRDTLKALCSIPAVSGREDNIRNYILGEVKNFAECRVDRNGNLICFKKGLKPSSKKIMVDAHMDEVGIIASALTSEGFVKFQTVGGISPAVMLGRRVIFENGVIGVVGVKPVHLASAEEKKKYPEEDSLYIDIGADSKEEAEKLICLGDTAVFEGDFYEMGENMIMSRAIDDRAGVAVLIRLLKEEAEYDFYATFTVQEEVGCRGAKTSAYSLDPDGAIVLEATTAADLHGVEDDKKVCVLGDGPAVSFMDRSTLYDRRLYDAAIKSGIKCQPKSAVAGGNNSGAVHLTRDGVPTIAISAPCRYIHSPCCVCDFGDIDGMYALAKEMLSRMASGELI